MLNVPDRLIDVEGLIMEVPVKLSGKFIICLNT